MAVRPASATFNRLEDTRTRSPGRPAASPSPQLPGAWGAAGRGRAPWLVFLAALLLQLLVPAHAGVPLRSAAARLQPACDWNAPGHAPFTGDLVAAVDAYRDIPADIRSRLQQRMARRSYDDLVRIRRDSIEGARTYQAAIRDMHFGGGRRCATVDRSRWPAAAEERGLVYCEAGHCLLVPTVCRNLSRISPAALGSGAGAAHGAAATAPRGSAETGGPAAAAGSWQDAASTDAQPGLALARPALAAQPPQAAVAAELSGAVDGPAGLSGADGLAALPTGQVAGALPPAAVDADPSAVALPSPPWGGSPGGVPWLADPWSSVALPLRAGPPASRLPQPVPLPVPVPVPPPVPEPAAALLMLAGLALLARVAAWRRPGRRCRRVSRA